MVATAKAKKESKEVYRKSRVNNSDKKLFRKNPIFQKQNGGGGGGGDLYHSQRISSVEVD